MRLLVLLSCVAFAVQAAQSKAADCAYDPVKTRISRTIAADSVNAPIYGHFLNKQDNRTYSRSLLLRDKEVILTFDDGPLPAQTGEVLDILDRHCVKATFFAVGRMAQANVKTIQDVDRRGHTIGTHTFSHPTKMDEMDLDEIKHEIEKGFIAVSEAVGKPISPFFRFPGLRDSPGAARYLSSRNISIWSVDVISGDTEPNATAGKIRRDTITRVKQQGRGIILFHDIKKPTVEALDGILSDLKSDGFKVVHVVSNASYQPNIDVIKRGDVLNGPMAQMTITGRLVAAAKERLKDGLVNVMHTEWVDLKQATEALEARPKAGVFRAGVDAAVKPPQYSNAGWLVTNRAQ